MPSARLTTALLGLALSLSAGGCKKDDAGPGASPGPMTHPAKPLQTYNRPMPPEALPDDADDLDRVRQQQQILHQVWMSVTDVADLKRKRAAILRSSLAGAKLTLKALKGAMSLSADKLQAFFEKNSKLRREHKEASVQIRLKRRALRKLPGGPEMLKELSAEIQRRSRPVYEELLKVTRSLLERRKELQAATMKPRAMAPPPMGK